MEHGDHRGRELLAGCGAVVVLGKELRRFPERARRELAARSAAAALVQPLLGPPGRVLTLEAPLRGQAAAGSAIVVDELQALGVPDAVVLQRQASRSTREEALLTARLAAELGLGRVLVITSRYHLARAARIFEEVMGPEAVRCVTPEQVGAALGVDEASPHGQRIRAGCCDRAALREEAVSERVFGLFAWVLRPLPRRWRWGLEVGAAVVLRGLG